MILKPSHLWFSAVLLAAALALMSSCNSGMGSSSPTRPGPVLELNSGDLGAGATFQHRFFVAGAYGYHCVHHAPMVGSVQVNDAAADTVVNVSIVSSTAPFPAATVKTGGRVVWTNNSTMVHTVTSN